jgi:hypothetical protein
MLRNDRRGRSSTEVFGLFHYLRLPVLSAIVGLKRRHARRKDPVRRRLTKNSPGPSVSPGLQGTKIVFKLLDSAPHHRFLVIVRVIAVVWFSEPETPVMVTVTEPRAAVLLAASVKTLVEAVLDGLKLAVTPEGSPEADRLTDPLKPFSGATVMVMFLLAPCLMLKFAGEAESEKSGAAAEFTVSERVVV